MEHVRMTTWMARGFALAAVFATAGACSSSATPRETHPYVFTNGDFETGTAGAAPPDWPVQPFLNSTGITVQTPQTRAGLNLGAGGKPLTTILNAPGGAQSQPDPDLGTTASLRWPRFGNQCVIVNSHSSTNFTSNGTNNGKNINSMSQTMTIGPGDVDPSDGQIHVRFVVAPVLQNPAHPANEQPYYLVQLTDITQSRTLLYSDFNLSGAAGIPWQTINGGTANEIDYTNWQLVDIHPGTIQMGDSVELEVIASGCEPGGHFGEIYVDGVGATVPGLFVSGTGPTQANACTNITYTLTYENGSATDATGVTVTFNTPPQTTYVSTNAPGLSCTALAAGTAGAQTCTVPGTVAAGTGGSFQITVNVGCTATGIVTAGNYSVQGTGDTPLIGPHVNTTVGCSVDSVCPTGDWCDEQANMCVPTLANGTLIPTDSPPHTNPTLDGTCTAAAGALVCTSAVCDTTDNECGFLNSDGPCTSSNEAVVCRSGVCDPDGSCGFAVDDGPCTVANGPALCRSGACSTSGVCEPPGGCDVDADCTGATWCDESTHTCTPQLSNGAPIPSDPPHVSPTLDALCTPAASLLVCASSVCDTKDNECGFSNGDGPCTAVNGGTVCRSAVCDPDGDCGFANGDGPCTTGNAATVCRSGACSTSLKCEPSGGCDVDADCTAGNWCNETTRACTPKLVNATPIPSDPAHTAPTLNGTCTVAAGALVCVSGVCDTSGNACGYANGDGPCTALTAATVCRSATCSVNGTCEAPGSCDLDADCTGGNWCNEATHTCTPKLVNGAPVPNDPTHTAPTLNGTCTQAAATLVCLSAVCDTNGSACGFANGDGPCTTLTAGTVCRSGSCSVNGTCEGTGTCDLDADCTGGNWCDESTHVCTAKLTNTTPIPSDPPHVAPVLNAKCTVAAATLVCVSGVCDTVGNGCGYANGEGPCTPVNGATVCQSGVCSPNAGVCIPAGGCSIDADCTTSQYCNTPASTCAPKVVNGQPVPTVTGHTPPLTGSCTLVAGTVACVSAVCDTTDNKCGFATGDGPCTTLTSGTVCRPGAACSVAGTCEPTGGCNVDADCSSGNWCNETAHACMPQLANGLAVPTDGAHANPTLNGTCTTAAGTLVCLSGVCDTSDNKCGYKNGDGPCTVADGATDCRSTLCAATGSSSGLCVACLLDSQCNGATPACNGMTHTCVQCTTSARCPSETPVCNVPDSKCVSCDGDFGSKAAEPCGTMAEPFCLLSGATPGECGKCTTNAECKGHSGDICDTASGLCTATCATDSDCLSSQWCDAASGSRGMCEAKLVNGKPLPSAPSSVATCSAAVGKRVCLSAVCDPKTEACGFAVGDGSCTNDAECVDGMCDEKTHTCGEMDAGAGCHKDTDCTQGHFCASDAKCTPTLPKGGTCDRSSECQSNDCIAGICSIIVSSGGGLSCSVHEAGSSRGAGDAGLFGLALALAGAGARRRRAGARRP